ncbi:T9SS type A sorting domain-containing protein [bacterium]|nr:T9SS type A sorting domain-containing protein [bacterium]
MLKTVYTLFFGSILLIGSQIVLSSSSNGRAFSANSGNTGAPGESQTCRNCHGTGFGATVAIEFRNLSGSTVNTYIPGMEYELTVKVNSTPGPARFGFQLVSLASNNTPYNAWKSPSANTRIANASNGRSYAEHNGKSMTNTFKVNWTAPSQGTGNITFYAGGAAVNNNGNTSGDGGNTNSLTITEDQSTSVIMNTIETNFNLFPNPVRDILSINNPTSTAFNGQLEIINLIGEQIKSNEIVIGPSSNYVLDLSVLESGIYFIQWTDRSGKKQIQRLVKQ